MQLPVTDAVQVFRASPHSLGWIESRPLAAVVGTFYSFVMGMTFVPAAWWWAVTLLAAGGFGFLCIKGVLSAGSHRVLTAGAMVVPGWLPL